MKLKISTFIALSTCLVVSMAGAQTTCPSIGTMSFTPNFLPADLSLCKKYTPDATSCWFSNANGVRMLVGTTDSNATANTVLSVGEQAISYASQFMPEYSELNNECSYPLITLGSYNIQIKYSP